MNKIFIRRIGNDAYYLPYDEIIFGSDWIDYIHDDYVRYYQQ